MMIILLTKLFRQVFDHPYCWYDQGNVGGHKFKTKGLTLISYVTRGCSRHIESSLDLTFINEEPYG